MTIQKGWHHAYETHYHIVFPVKYRKALLRDNITQSIKEIAKEIEYRYDITFEQIGCVKSITAKELFKQFPDLKKELWGGSFWSSGYYLATVLEKGNWKAVEKYVKNQGTKGNTKEVTQLKLL